MIPILGIQIERAGAIEAYRWPWGDPVPTVDQHVLVQTKTGELELGRVRKVSTLEETDAPPELDAMRLATATDLAQAAANDGAALYAKSVAKEAVERLELDMHLVDAHYTFERDRLYISFTAEGRIDFRRLVRDLAQKLNTRIELRQIGVRDEAKKVGGYGVCGNPLCCHQFLTEFAPVSIKMAKEQSLSLNPAKISGCCGRLLCCLNYENEHYKETNRLLKEEAKKNAEAKEEAPQNDTEIMVEEAVAEAPSKKERPRRNQNRRRRPKKHDSTR